MVYRFIGTESDIGDSSLKRFGQAVELSDDLARDAILGGCAILPDAEYSAAFAPDDDKKFASPGVRTRAPEDFKARMKAALDKMHELREIVAAGGVIHG